MTRTLRRIIILSTVAAVVFSCVRVHRSVNNTALWISLPFHKEAVFYAGNACGVPVRGFQVWDVKQVTRTMIGHQLLYDSGGPR